MYKIISVSIFIFIFITGCASSQRLYEGRKLGGDEVSTLSGQEVEEGTFTKTNVIQIRGLNGKPIGPDNMLANTIEVIPGRYKVDIGYFNTKYYRYASFEWIAEAGERYRINFNKQKLNVDSPPPTPMVKTWLEDQNGKIIQYIDNWTEIKELIIDRQPLPIVIPVFL